MRVKDTIVADDTFNLSRLLRVAQAAGKSAAAQKLDAAHQQAFYIISFVPEIREMVRNEQNNRIALVAFPKMLREGRDSFQGQFDVDMVIDALETIRDKMNGENYTSVELLMSALTAEAFVSAPALKPTLVSVLKESGHQKPNASVPFS